MPEWVAPQVSARRKGKRLALDTYPDVALKLVRERATEARKARKWYPTVYVPAVSEGQTKRTLGRLEINVFPWLGSDEIATLSVPRDLETLRRVDSRGAVETAHRELQAIGQNPSVCNRYRTLRARSDRDLKGASKPFQTTPIPAIAEPERVGALLRAIDGYERTSR